MALDQPLPFTATRSVDVPGRIGGKATLTIVLRRTGMSAGGAMAATGGAVAAAGDGKAAERCAAPVTTAAEAGGAVGAQVLGAQGRQLGAAVGGLFGALGGAAKKIEPTTLDCPR